MSTLNDLANKSLEHAKQKGFIKDADKFDYQMFRQLAMLHTEISELTEAFCKGALIQQCDKAIPMTCLQEEIADILIRTLCLAGYCDETLGFGDIDACVQKKMDFNTTRVYMHGKRV